MTMREKAKPCTKFAKHKWVFFKNINDVRQTLRSVTIKKRGVYRCECGEVRIGQMGFETDAAS